MNPKITKELTPILKGDKYRRTHKASVMGILGNDTPRVDSRGSLFFNRDHWTTRLVLKPMCDWATANPGCMPVKQDINQWVKWANQQPVPNREIVIANTPKVLPLRTAMALTGGAYHEAFHTKYSCRRNVSGSELANIIIPRWAKVKDWSKLIKALADWTNIIEDIHIEQCGRKDFEGTYIKLCDLQDYILQMEQKSYNNARSHQVEFTDAENTISIITRAFRDLGLGYNTEIQRDAIEGYKKENIEACNLVSKGPLRPLIEASINMSPDDDLGSLSLAMDVLAAIGDLAEQNESDQENKNKGAGDGETKCPQCGADADKLVVRPKPDGQGGKVKGKGVCTCVICGYQEEVDVQLKQPESTDGQPQQPQKSPKFEGFEPEDFDTENTDSGDDQKSDDSGDDQKSDKKSDKKQKGSSSGQSSSDKDDSDSDSDNEGKGSGSDNKDDNTEEGKGSSKDVEEGGSDACGTDSNEKSDDESGLDDRDSNKNSDDKGADKGEELEKPNQEGNDNGDPQSKTKNDDSESSEGDSGEDINSHDNAAGGYDYKDGPQPGKDWSELANQAMGDIESGKETGVQDSSSALQDGFADAKNKEDKDVKDDEAVWKPYNPSLDEIEFVCPSSKGKEHDRQQASYIIKSVKEEAAYFRARLRSVIKSIEMTSTFHGVPKGRRLSNRFLVDSKISLKANQAPSKAYYKKGQRIDMTIAAAIVIDESYSMKSLLVDAAKMMTAITEPLDSLGCATMACGFRNGHHRYSTIEDAELDMYHRWGPIRIDIFKAWHERFKVIQWRFANTLATGSTPMADGVEYALQGLSLRDEAHRFMFVITDGCPDSGHEPIIKRQIRQAKDAGIHIIGVGVGSGAQYVKGLFDDYVYSNKIKEIPKMLIAKLNELADIRGGRRGKRVKKHDLFL